MTSKLSQGYIRIAGLFRNEHRTFADCVHILHISRETLRFWRGIKQSVRNLKPTSVYIYSISDSLSFSSRVRPMLITSLQVRMGANAPRLRLRLKPPCDVISVSQTLARRRVFPSSTVQFLANYFGTSMHELLLLRCVLPVSTR